MIGTNKAQNMPKTIENAIQNDQINSESLSEGLLLMIHTE